MDLFFFGMVMGIFSVVLNPFIYRELVLPPSTFLLSPPAPRPFLDIFHCIAIFAQLPSHTDTHIFVLCKVSCENTFSSTFSPEIKFFGYSTHNVFVVPPLAVYSALLCAQSTLTLKPSHTAGLQLAAGNPVFKTAIHSEGA